MALLTPDEIRNINDYQVSGCWHPLTCGNDSGHSLLIATKDGLHCPDCTWKQTLIPQFIRDGLWREHVAKMDALRSSLDELQIVRKPPKDGGTPPCR